FDLDNRKTAGKLDRFSFLCSVFDSVSVDTNGFPQIFMRRGLVLHTRFGPWNGVRFSGMPSLRNPTSVNEFVVNDKEIYYGYKVNAAVVSRMYLDPQGDTTRMNWLYGRF
nr:G-type lectin S-receptor-like serine/threonine-protein kinase At4g27290 [Tanacetum cinerariifolium]